MSDRLHEARDFRELLTAPDDAGPYVYDRLFSDKGWRARRLSKQKFKLLRRVDDALRPMLRQGERVVFITRGTMVSFRESVFLGNVMYYLNRRAILLTTQRILLLQITTRGWPRDFRSEIAYGAITRLKGSGLGNTKLRFRDGTSRVFAGVPRQDRKVLRALIDRITAEGAPDQAAAPGPVELCPHCYEPVPERADACPACGGRFKSPRTAGVLSFLFPGFGDLYLGHYWFAAAEIVGAAVLWLSVGVATVLDPAIGAAEIALIAVLLFLFVHGVDAVATAYVASRGLAAETARPGGMRFALAAVPLLLIAGGTTVGAAGRTGLRPSGVVVPGAELPPKHASALVRSGMVEAGEEIGYFYSAGTASILQDGNLFTDRRVISYERTIDTLWYEAAAYDEVVDLDARLSADPAELSRLIVVADDGRAFFLVLSPAGGGDSVFAAGVTQRWRAARERGPVGEVWFDGGSGYTPADAVVIRGAASGAAAREAISEWLTRWLDPDWRLAGLTRRVLGGRTIDEAIVDFADGERGAYYFDVTEYAGR